MMGSDHSVLDDDVAFWNTGAFFLEETDNGKSYCLVATTAGAGEANIMLLATPLPESQFLSQTELLGSSLGIAGYSEEGLFSGVIIQPVNVPHHDLATNNP